MLAVIDGSNGDRKTQVCEKTEPKHKVSIMGEHTSEMLLESDKNLHGVFVADSETSTVNVNPTNESVRSPSKGSECVNLKRQYLLENS